MTLASAGPPSLKTSSTPVTSTTTGTTSTPFSSLASSSLSSSLSSGCGVAESSSVLSNDGGLFNAFSRRCWYIVHLDVEKSKFINAKWAVLEGDVVAVHVLTDPISSSTNASGSNHISSFSSTESFPLPPSLLKRGNRCFVCVRKAVRRLYESLIPSRIAEERIRRGEPDSTGWLRHECFGLVATIRIPIGGPGFNVSKLDLNKRGIRCMDFEGVFECLQERESIQSTPKLPRHVREEEEVNNDGPSFLEFSADKDDILTIKQSDLQERLTRHKHFAKWLVQIFGMDTLKQGSGVLDVAGGNGKLAAALVELGIPCTIVDPQPFCPSTSDIAIIAEPLEGAGERLTNASYPQSELVRTCSIVVGLHPDQATEAVVDLALRVGKPFAVSPCCVMTKLFPHRRQKQSGDPVRTVWALCRYLLDKAPPTAPFDVDFLPFAGRNKVIYWRSPQMVGQMTTGYCQEISQKQPYAYDGIEM